MNNLVPCPNCGEPFCPDCGEHYPGQVGAAAKPGVSRAQNTKTEYGWMFKGPGMMGSYVVQYAQEMAWAIVRNRNNYPKYHTALMARWRSPEELIKEWNAAGGLPKYETAPPTIPGAYWLANGAEANDNFWRWVFRSAGQPSQF